MFCHLHLHRSTSRHRLILFHHPEDCDSTYFRNVSVKLWSGTASKYCLLNLLFVWLDFGVRSLFVSDATPSFRLTLPSLYSGWHSEGRVWSRAAFRGAGVGTWCCPTGTNPVVQKKGLKTVPRADFCYLKLCLCLCACPDWRVRGEGLTFWRRNFILILAHLYIKCE